MQATIVTRRGVYYGRYVLENGNRVERSLQTRDAGQAKIRLGLYASEVLAATTPKPSKEGPLSYITTFQDFANRPRKGSRRHKEKQEHLWYDLWSELPVKTLDRLTFRHVRDWVDEKTVKMQEQQIEKQMDPEGFYARHPLNRRGQGKGELTEYYIAVRVRNASTVWNLMRIEGVHTIAGNPFSGAAKGKASMESQVVVPLTESEDAAALAACEQVGRDMLLLYALCRFAGARYGEAERARWKHVDFENGIITIDGTKTKTSKLRRVPLSPTLKEILIRHKPMFSDESKEVHIIRPENKEGNNKCMRWNCAKSMEKVRKLSGLPLLHLHQLRHTFATRQLSNGVALHVVSRWLGHSSVNITHQVYNHWVGDTLTMTD